MVAMKAIIVKISQILNTVSEVCKAGGDGCNSYIWKKSLSCNFDWFNYRTNQSPTNTDDSQPSKKNLKIGENMDTPKVFADFHNADSQGRLRLNCTGTKASLF